MQALAQRLKNNQGCIECTVYQANSSPNASYKWCVRRERVHRQELMGQSASTGGLRTLSTSETGGNPAWALRSDAVMLGMYSLCQLRSLCRPQLCICHMPVPMSNRSSQSTQ